MTFCHSLIVHMTKKTQTKHPYHNFYFHNQLHNTCMHPLKFITYHIQPTLLHSSLQKIEPFTHNCSFNYLHTTKQYRNIILLQRQLLASNNSQSWIIYTNNNVASLIHPYNSLALVSIDGLMSLHHYHMGTKGMILTYITRHLFVPTLFSLQE